MRSRLSAPNTRRRAQRALSLNRTPLPSRPPRLATADRGAGFGRQSVARAASRIRSVTAEGREFIGTCEARTWAMVAPVRWAMNRCVAGGIARSSVATRYHEGIVFQAGGPESSSRIPSSNGRWVAACGVPKLGSASRTRLICRREHSFGTPHGHHGRPSAQRRRWPCAPAHQPTQMSATSAPVTCKKSPVGTRSECSCDPASSTIESRSAKRLSTTTGSCRPPPIGGTAPRSNSG